MYVAVNRGQGPLPQGEHNNCQREAWEGKNSAAQNLKDLFKFRAYLFDYLLTLRDI